MTVMEVEGPRKRKVRTPEIVFVCGDRKWTDEVLVHYTLGKHRPGTFILAGGCRGADLIAEARALELGFQPIRMDAPWKYYGRSAGPIRNRSQGLILSGLRRAGFILHAYVFHDSLDDSKGTADMVSVLNTLSIPFRHISHVPEP